MDVTKQLRQELISLAIELAKEYGANLDFRHESIREVETMLHQFHLEYRRAGDPEGMNGLAHILGAYIVEVIERNTEPGRWDRDHAEFGENTFPYYWHGQTLFPVIWCQKRIFDGEGDNVWSKYQALVLSHVKSE